MTRAVEIPFATAKLFDIKKGDVIRISTPEGRQWGDLSFPGFHQAVTRAINGWERFNSPKQVFEAGPGTKLCDGEGRPMFEMGEATPDLSSDIMYSGCYRELFPDGRPGCRDLLSEALGVSRGDLPGVLSFFMSIDEIDREGYCFGPVTAEPGSFITLKALVDTPLAITACPDDLTEGVSATSLRVEISGE